MKGQVGIYSGEGREWIPDPLLIWRCVGRGRTSYKGDMGVKQGGEGGRLVNGNGREMERRESFKG